MNTIKFKQNQILKLNNKIYIPFLIHNLPNNYNKINIKYILKIKSFIYIEQSQLNNSKTILNLINSSNINKYSNK